MAMQTRIKQRLDPLSSWIQSDIVLLRGELAVVDCGSQTRFKIGDGTKRFTQLPFVDQSQLCTHWIAADAISQGLNAKSIPYGFAAGAYLCADANFSQALGFDAQTVSSDMYSFVWSGDDTRAIGDYYQSHGKGTFSINPLSGLSGVFIGEQSLAEVLDARGGNKTTIDDRISGICQQSDLSVVKLGASEYSTLLASGSLLSNALYIVEDDHADAYGEQIKNLAPGTDLSDAVNLEQLGQVSASIPTRTSQLENDSSFISAHQSLSSYYSKTETSSSTQLAAAFSGKLEPSEVKISYASGARKIVLSSRSTTTSVDCNDFIKDGMLSSAELCGTTLVLTFNTDASSEPISVELSSFVDNYDEKINELSSEKIGYADQLEEWYPGDPDTWPAGSKFIYENVIYESLSGYDGIHQPDVSEHCVPCNLATVRYVDASVPKNVSQLSNDAGYLTQHQSLSSYYTKDETYSSPEVDGIIDDVSAALDSKTEHKIFIENKISGIAGYSDLSVVRLSAGEYASMLAAGALLSNGLYIVEDQFENMYGQQIKNVALPTDLSDAATKGYVDSQISSKAELSDVDDAISEQVVPAMFRNVQLVKPSQPEGQRLHLRGDIARDDQFEDIVAAGIDTADGSSYQLVKYFVSDGVSGTWKTMESAGLYTDADDVPASFYFADALSSAGETPKISSQYFFRYYWYYDLSGTVHKSDQFSIAVPSNTAVGANPGDVVHRGEFYDLKQTVQPLKQTVSKDTAYNRYYVCKPMTVSEITDTLAGEFDVLLDDYESSQIYRMQFTVGSADATPTFYVDYGNGPEVADTLKANIDSYVFKAGKSYYAELQGDVLKVDTLGYAKSGSDVAVGQVLTSGTKIATISVDGNPTDVYAPADLSAFTNSPGYLVSNDISGIQQIAWADLVDLAQTSALAPGMKYRITDYVTTVDQEDCRSAEHPFDLIVTAIDHHTLDEHAIATLPSNGDDYFDARPFHVASYQQYLEYARVPLETWDIKYCLDNDKTRFKFADTTNGKGIIYYMKDEFGNEAPYDFKNVQFKRYKITSSQGATSLEGMYGLAVGSIEVDTSDEMWCYTFNGDDYAELGFSEPYDFSGWHVRPTQAVVQQFSSPSIECLQECAGNVIQARQDDSGDYSLMSFKLPNNVFHCALTETPVDELPFLKVGICAGNKLGLNCYDNTFGSNCSSNTFGNDCSSNTFGNDCYSNTFGNDCYSNTFGSNCSRNTFGNYCSLNTFGNDCYSNTFGSNCSRNTFGNDCYSNTFGNYCSSNTFGNDCYSNTFGNDCSSNTFGNDCYSIKFASTDTSDPNLAKSYYKCITVDSGNQYIILNCTQSTYSKHEYKNVRILPGVNNTTTYKTITDSNVGQSFCTTYQPANSQVIAV